MKIKIILSFAIPTIILFLFFFGLNNDNNYSTANLIGKKIENIQLENLKDNQKNFINEIVKNNYTLINFWASWCAPCRSEHKFLLSLKKKTDLEILGITFKDKKNNSLNFLEELGNPYHNLVKDNNGKVSVSFGVYGIPESILIDKNLKIIKKFIGPLDESDYKEILQIIGS